MSNIANRPDSASGSDLAALEKGNEGHDLVQTSAGSAHEGSAEPQEGGTKAWLAVAGSAAGMFVSFGWVNCIGLFQAEYEINQLKSYSTSDVAWITSMECKDGQLSFPRLLLT